MSGSNRDEASAVASAIQQACAMLDGEDRQEIVSFISALARNKSVDAETLTMQAVTTLSPMFNIRRAIGRRSGLQTPRE